MSLQWSGRLATTPGDRGDPGERTEILENARRLPRRQGSTAVPALFVRENWA